MESVQAPENRVIAHFKFLVVTCNYVARGLGVPKMVSIAEAKRKLPAIVLVNGEDLTPYRADNKRILAVLRRYGTVEKLGLDEGTVDITAQVQARVQGGSVALSFSGHVLGFGPMVEMKGEHQNSTLINFEEIKLNYDSLPLEDVLLLLGSQVVAEIRTALERETGFHCSCGIAQNKMLAKLSSSLNKPNMQTCLLGGAVFDFLSPLSVRKIPGVGKQMQAVLSDLGVETIIDLRKLTLNHLSERVGDRVALFLFNACRGQDHTLVQDKGPPKSISVEDSFKNCQTLQNVEGILRVLAPDLIRRLDEDREETGRRPKSFTVKWRMHGSKWSFASASTQMPQDLLEASTSIGQRAFLAVDVAMKLLSRSLGQGFHLAALNIGATNFVDECTTISPRKCDIRAFLQGQGKSPGKELKVTSKRDARARRESFKAMVDNTGSAEALPSCFDSQTGTVETKSLRGRTRGWNDAWAEGYDLSNSSEEEEMDDLAGLLRLPAQQNLLPRRGDAKRMSSEHVPTSSFPDSESHEKQGARFSHEGKFSTFPLSPQIKDRIQSCVSGICKDCGESVEDNEIARQEHADYHFALTLDLQETGTNSRQTPESSRFVPSTKRQKLVFPSPGTLRKSRDGTLDSFLLRSE